MPLAKKDYKLVTAKELGGLEGTWVSALEASRVLGITKTGVYNKVDARKLDAVSLFGFLLVKLPKGKSKNDTTNRESDESDT